jgi:hypothetical protein
MNESGVTERYSSGWVRLHFRTTARLVTAMILINPDKICIAFYRQTAAGQ